MNAWPDFLFSTSINFNLFSKGKVKTLFHNIHSTYGITWSDTHLYVGSSNWVVKLNNRFEVENRILNESKWDVHQILFSNNKLYIIHPGRKTVEVCNRDLTRSKEILIPGDYSHMNSIFYKDDLFYICHHNNGLGGKAFISIHDENLDKIDTIENVGTANHNVYVENDNLYTLNSKSCCFVKYDTINKKFQGVDMEPDRFARGLARTKENFIIGLAPSCPVRTDRNEIPSKVVILNNDMEIVDGFVLGFEGQIRDLRALKGDLAHNKIDFPFMSEVGDIMNDDDWEPRELNE